MPDVSADILSSFQANKQNPNVVGDAFAQGAQVAQRQLGLELQQEQLEEQKRVNDQTIIDNKIKAGQGIMGLLKNLPQIKSQKGKKLILEQINGYRRASGGEDLDPILIEELMASPEEAARLHNNMEKIVEALPPGSRERQVAEASLPEFGKGMQTLSELHQQHDELLNFAKSVAVKESERQVKRRGQDIQREAGLARLFQNQQEFQQGMAFKRQELEQKKEEAKTKREQKLFDDKLKVRETLSGEAGRYFAVSTGVHNIRDAVARGEAFADVGILFDVIKVWDPGSVVRKSEAEAFADAGSLSQRFEVMFDRIRTGESLTGDQRALLESLMTERLAREASQYILARRPKVRGILKRGAPLDEVDPSFDLLTRDSQIFGVNLLSEKLADKNKNLLPPDPKQQGAQQGGTQQQKQPQQQVPKKPKSQGIQRIRLMEQLKRDGGLTPQQAAALEREKKRRGLK